MRQRIRNLVVAWADRIKEERSERRKEHEAAREEAQGFVLRAVVGDDCVYVKGSRTRYCDRCPLGSFDGPLSRQAQRMVCTKSRVYSK